MARPKPTSRQKRNATEFGGADQLQNTLHPAYSVNDLSASDKARLIKRTGQTAKVDASADIKHFYGQ